MNQALLERTRTSLLSAAFAGAIVLLATPAMATTYYISPANSNLVIFHSVSAERHLHVTSPRVRGELIVTAGQAALRLRADLRHLISEEGYPSGRLDSWLFETLTYPDLELELERLEDFPDQLPAHGDTLKAIGHGHLRFHGETRPVAMPLQLVASGDPEQAPTSWRIMGAIDLQPAEYGILVPEWMQELMNRVRLQVFAQATSAPEQDWSPEFLAIWQRTRNLALDEQRPFITPTHLLLGLLEEDGRLLVRVGADTTALKRNAWTQLERERPDSTSGRPRADPRAEQVMARAEWESYELGADQVEHGHLLLALIGATDSWAGQELAAAGLTRSACLQVLRGTPRHPRTVEYLGGPLYADHKDSVAMRYARNVWDLQVWEGRLYIGSGNSSNDGPAVNAGPVPIISMNLASGVFEEEFVVDDEQVDRFRIIDGKLHVPGHDPRDPWELGNFYRLDGKLWTKVRTIPLGIHAYDMLGFQGEIYVAEGTTKGAMISRSADGGQTWTSYILPGVVRAYELFTVGSELFVSTYGDQVFRFTGEGFVPCRVDLFPDSDHSGTPLVVRSVRCGDVLLYIGADNINDHQWMPFAVYAAERIDGARRLAIPSTDVPYDILVRGDRAWLLTNRRMVKSEDTAQDALYTVIVYSSDDLRQWQEVVRFAMPSFARSFELHDGTFYAGLGTRTAPLSPDAGKLYRVVPAAD